MECDDMQMKYSRRPVLVVAAAVLATSMLVACASTSTTTTPATPDTSALAKQVPEGLIARDSRRLDKLYVRPGARLGLYTSVIIDKADVSFDKNWDPNRDLRDVSRRVTEQDKDRIKADLAKMLDDTFVAQWKKAGYNIATAPGAGTLRIKPSIVDLYVNAPDVMAAGRSRNYVREAGKMTLVADLIDAQTGQLVARAVDTKRGTDYGYMQIANRVTNAAEAERVLTQWGRLLTRSLDDLKKTAP
jgi:hypothetical protein